MFNQLRSWTRRLRRRLKVAESLQRFEISTPLPVEDCLRRLTGRHPPFQRRERIARPHPFDGYIEGDEVVVPIGDRRAPFELIGRLVSEPKGTRFQADLCYVHDPGWSVLQFPLWLITIFMISVLIPPTMDREPAYWPLLFPFAFALPTTITLVRKRPFAKMPEPPDPSETLRVMSNLILAPGWH